VGLTGDPAGKVKPQVRRGCVVMPPAALTQLIREVGTWVEIHVREGFAGAKEDSTRDRKGGPLKRTRGPLPHDRFHE